MNIPGLRKFKNFFTPLALRVLPAPLSKYIAYKLAGYGNIPRKLRKLVRISRGTDHLEITFSGGSPLRFNVNLEKRIFYQFRENRDCFFEALSFLSLSKGKKVFWDIGAADGLFSALFLKHNLEGKAFAFEPSEIQAQRFLETFSGDSSWKRLVLEKKAAYSSSGFLQTKEGDKGYLRPLGAGEAGGKLVPSIRLDDWLEEGAHPPPDILKVDVEGGEYEVLQGAKKTIQRHKPLLFLEIHLNYLDSISFPPGKLIGFLNDQGYKFYSHKNKKEFPPKNIANSPKSVLRVFAMK